MCVCVCVCVPVGYSLLDHSPCRYQQRHTESKYGFAGRKDNIYTSGTTIRNEAYMTEQPADDEMPVHSVRLKFGDEASSEEEEEDEEERKGDEKRVLQLEEEETHQ